MFIGAVQEIQKLWQMQVVDGAKEKGADVTLYECADFRPELVADYDAIAFGCPAMGDEVLEEDEFEPMFDGCKAELKDKKNRTCSDLNGMGRR